MRTFSRVAVFVTLMAALAAAGGLLVSSGPASAAAPDPTQDETARLLGYMWGDGSQDGEVWDINGPSGTSTLIEALVEAHGGTWVDRGRLTFTLPAPYDWADWKDGLPNNSQAVLDAVENPHFLAALFETEADIYGHIYDQSQCCVDGFTHGRLTALRDLLLRNGYESAEIVGYGNVDSGKITIQPSDFAEVRSLHTFACPTSKEAIRLPGGTESRFGELQWMQPGSQWGHLVRGDCPIGLTVQDPSPHAGTCSAVANGNRVTVEWTFSLGDVVLRRNGSYLDTVSARADSWSEDRANGEYSYEARSLAFGVKNTVSCGTVVVTGEPLAAPGEPEPEPVGPAPVEPVEPEPVEPEPVEPPTTPASSSCVVAPTGNNHVLISWDDMGKESYSLRRNNSWVASTVGGNRSAVVAGSVDEMWIVRYRVQGNPVDMPCAIGEQAGGGLCSAVAAEAGIDVEWNAVTGQNSYHVRKNGSWLAKVTDSTSFADLSGSTEDTYLIRYRQNGEIIDVDCG